MMPAAVVVQRDRRSTFAEKGTHSALDGLVCGYSSRVRAEKVIVTLQAYVDESSGTQQGNILLLAACIHKYDAWAKFSDDWQMALDAEPRIKHFHCREARNRDKEFSGLTELERDLKVITLTDVVMRHEPFIYVCWVNVDDYNAILRPAGPPDFRHAYFACYYSTIVTVSSNFAKWGITTPIDYVFDEHGDVGQEAQFWYSEIKGAVPSNVSALMGSTPIFRNDEDVLPLQAADLIAWHKRRRLEFGATDAEVAASLRIDELWGAYDELDTKFLRDLASTLSKVPGIEDSHKQPSVFRKLKRDHRKAQRRKP